MSKKKFINDAGYLRLEKGHESRQNRTIALALALGITSFVWHIVNALGLAAWAADLAKSVLP